jgi:TRAP-type C4-dicarboxylate transport system permease small subunit
MNSIKKFLGIIWMLLALAAAYFIIHAAAINIKSNAKLDINKPLPWIIIIIVFLPVAAGLFLFGYYALKGEYSRKSESQ